MSLYVSDILEGLLDATAVRNALREHCIGLLADADVQVRARLAAAAYYVGGKCMGYPAIWFIERALAPDVQAGEIINSCEPALSISLTTSIVDDLVDGDEIVAPEYAAYLYVLLGKVISKHPAGFGHENGVARSFLNHALDVCRDPNAGADVMGRRGDRIGHFYRMIATGAVEAFAPRLSEGGAFIEAIGRFGQCCAHLDDWIDLETDMQRGVGENVAVGLLRARYAPSGGNGAVERRDVPWLASEMQTMIAGQLDGIIAALRDLRAPLLIEALQHAIKRLPGVLRGVKPHAFAGS